MLSLAVEAALAPVGEYISHVRRERSTNSRWLHGACVCSVRCTYACCWAHLVGACQHLSLRTCGLHLLLAEHQLLACQARRFDRSAAKTMSVLAGAFSWTTMDVKSRLLAELVDHHRLGW